MERSPVAHTLVGWPETMSPAAVRSCADRTDDPSGTPQTDGYHLSER